MGLQFGGRTTSRRGLTTTKRGGIALHEAPTRRRHANSQLLMLQNPHRHRHEGRRRNRGAWPCRPLAHSSPALQPGPVPRKSAGPQATTSSTQQHVVSYKRGFSTSLPTILPESGTDALQAIPCLVKTLQ